MSYVEASLRSKQLVQAARSVLAREGVAHTSLRAVAAEGAVSLGTLQYVFPSKELLLQAVIEDMVEEIAGILHTVIPTDGGLVAAIRQGLSRLWSEFVQDQIPLQMLQYELMKYALRTPGQEHLARWQYERYTSVLAERFQAAATHAGEVAAISCAQLARTLLAGMDGLILQYLCDPEGVHVADNLDALIDMLITHARIRPA